MPQPKITASDLYSYTSCPHRVYRDAHDDPRLRDPVNEFVQLLWNHGTQHEDDCVAMIWVKDKLGKQLKMQS